MLDEEHQERITRAIENACLAIESAADNVSEQVNSLLVNEVARLVNTMEYKAR